MKNNNNNDKGKSMENAYRIAHEMIKDRLKEKDPSVYREMQDQGDVDVIVVRGQYDMIEKVLSMSGTPFTLIDPPGLENMSLRPDQIVFINCPGNLSPLSNRKLQGFVAEGGFLFTTDWALKHVLEEAFPGYLAYNERATRDEVVRVEILDTDDPFLKSILSAEDDPQWWLEGSSYPIRIVDRDKVKVLVTSKEIGEKYGETPVFVTFDHGQGKVYHMISHFYLQRSETRSERHKAPAESYLTLKEIPLSARAKYKRMGILDHQLGEVESAFTSNAMVEKIMLEKRLQIKRGKK